MRERREECLVTGLLVFIFIWPHLGLMGSMPDRALYFAILSAKSAVTSVPRLL